MVAAPESIAPVVAMEVSGKLAQVQGENTFTSTLNRDASGNGTGAIAGDSLATGNGQQQEMEMGMERSNAGTPTSIPPPEIARNIPCRNFPNGTCKYGNHCAFNHVGVASVAPVQQQMHMQQQPEEYQQVDQNGMPLYYQQGMMDGSGGQQYGGQQFSPQQGYYAYPSYPTNFQPYSQHYPPPPPHQQPHYFQSPPTGPVPSPSNNPVEPLLNIGAGVPSPSSANNASQVQTLPHNPYAPYQPQQQNYHNSAAPEFVGGLPSPSVPLSPTSSAQAPSLHTFFQTGAPPPPPQTSSSIPNATTPPFVLPSPATLPRTNALAARRPPGPNGPLRANNGSGPFHPNNNNGFAPTAGTRLPSKNPCSFFQANRCRNGDICHFVHLLPDGTDARLLKVAMIGQDGRLDNPETQGGMPPFTKFSSRASFGGMNGMGVNGMGMNAGGMQRNGGGGGYAKADPFFRGPRQAQQHQTMMAQQQPQPTEAYNQQQQPQGVPSAVSVGAAEADLQRMSLLDPAVVGIQGAGVSYVPGSGAARPLLSGGGGAPGLVAAINGLTRRIPPVVNASAASATLPTPPVTPSPAVVAAIPTSSGTNPTAAQAASQRIPSGADFPALSSAPLSPTSTNGDATFPSSVAVAPVGPTIAKIVATAPAPVVVVVAAPVVPAVVSKSPAPSPPSESSDSDFVMVSHAEAIPPTTSSSVVAAPVATALAPVVLPKVMSFASAAARGAAVPVPAVPERARKAAPVPVVVSAEDSSAPVVAKEGKKAKRVNKERKEREANGGVAGAKVHLAQVAVAVGA